MSSAIVVLLCVLAAMLLGVVSVIAAIDSARDEYEEP
jgi:hypothetical protein